MTAISLTAVLAALAVMDVRVLMTSNAVRATIFLVGLVAVLNVMTTMAVMISQTYWPKLM